jgi:large subunit ribosomal protein L10
LAITRQKKEELVKKYIENIDQSTAIFLTEYKGLSVNEMTELRHKLNEAQSYYVVVKNTLAIRALNEIGINGSEGLFEGPVGISFCFGDPPPVAKALVEFAKSKNEFSIKAGFLGQTSLTVEGVEALAELPPLEVVRAQLLGVISAPATQLAGVVASGVRQVINVVKAYADSEEAEAEAEAA